MYTKNELIEIATDVFASNGIDIDDKVAIDNMDSLEYISILVGLEQGLNIVFPDSILVNNIFVDMEGFYSILIFILGDHFLE